MSADAYMLYHQNMLAQVKAGSRRRAASQMRSPETSRFDCRQNKISERSRKYQPLPTIPWSRGNKPVRYVVCTGQVTAGKLGVSGRIAPASASARNAGV